MTLIVHETDKDDLLRDLVRVHYSHRKSIKAGQVCRVSANCKAIIATARNSPHNDSRGIWLDDAQRKKLKVEDGQEGDFSIEAARWYEEFLWMWRSSDPVNRIAGRLGILSFVLGIIGLVLGAWSVYLALKFG